MSEGAKKKEGTEVVAFYAVLRASRRMRSASVIAERSRCVGGMVARLDPVPSIDARLGGPF